MPGVKLDNFLKGYVVLIELLEAERVDYSDEKVSYVYELYQGDWVQLYTNSGNPYWHTVEAWQKHYSEYTPIKQAQILVMSDGGYIGHWNNKEEFYEFLDKYLRATVIEKVTPDDQVLSVPL